MKPFGDGFIKLIKMIIAPVIFCTVVLGIAGAEDLKKVGRTGGLALLYFEGVSTLSLILGPPGGEHRPPRRGHECRRAHARPRRRLGLCGRRQNANTKDFLLGIVPRLFLTPLPAAKSSRCC